MGEVTISVAGRAYQVICEDGEENRLNAIAARVDREAQAFGGATPSLSEARLLLMCSLLLADKLDEAEKNASPAPAPTVVDTSGIEEAAARIEALANGAPVDGGFSEAASQAAETVIEEAQAAEPTSEPVEAAQSERRSKSSAATAAEKDLLSWLDRPETRGEDLPETTPDATPDEASESEQSEITSDPAPAAAPEESEEERAARERSARRARRRERLAKLSNKNE